MWITSPTWLRKINQQDADIVIIAGDIFDNSYDGMDDPEGIKAQLRSIKSKYGVYAVYGNHDIDEKKFSWDLPLTGAENSSTTRK